MIRAAPFIFSVEVTRSRRGAKQTPTGGLKGKPLSRFPLRGLGGFPPTSGLGIYPNIACQQRNPRILLLIKRHFFRICQFLQFAQFVFQKRFVGKVKLIIRHQHWRKTSAQSIPNQKREQDMSL